MFLLFISFIAGVLTALAPCVLPLLPVIVGGSMSAGGEGGKSVRRAIVISISLGASVILFTLLLKVSSVFINVPPSFWLWFSGTILVLFGVVMIFPRLWDSLGFVNLMNRSSNRLLATGYQKDSLWGDIIMGAALGPVFSSCSPTYFVILATVLPTDFLTGLLNLFVYALGLSGFLLLIALAGQRLVDRLGVAIEPGGWFRRSIGVLFLVVGIAIMSGAEKKLEVYLAAKGFDLTYIERMLLEANQAKSNVLNPMMCEGDTCLGDKIEGSTDVMATTAAEQMANGDMEKDAMEPAPQTPAKDVPTVKEIIAKKAKQYPMAPELVGPDGYINTPRLPSGQAGPITIGEFKGKKVVLIDIWTYSCINCQRTLPYIKAWYEKYKDQGLEIIGVHTPEFAFERVYQNVKNASDGFGLTYPIVLDNGYRTWTAFGNQFWPRKYLIDIDGFIVYDHAGEGEYAETEEAIQKALAERAKRLGAQVVQDGVTAPKDVMAVDFGKVGSPETYFGSARNNNFGSGKPGVSGLQSFEEPVEVKKNTLYLLGPWDIQPEYAETPASVGGSAGSARIDFLYHAKSVYFVAGSADDSPIEVEVLRDSKPLDKASAGADVHFKGGKSYFTVTGNRLYKVIENGAYEQHLLEFIIGKPGLQAYTFTFG